MTKKKDLILYVVYLQHCLVVTRLMPRKTAAI